MRKRTIATMLVVAFVSFVLADAASAYYSPRLGRFLNRDPIGEPGARVASAATNTTQFIPRDALPGGLEGNLYRFVDNAPTNTVDPDGREPCKRDVFPGVTVQKFNNSIGHEWLNIGGAYRGFYPNPGKSFPLIQPGQWQDETTINLWPVEDPPGSGHYVYVPRIYVAFANDWYDEWNTRRRCTGKLGYGDAKGTPCCSAKPEQIINCLLKRTEPGTPGLYLLIGGNCMDHAENALTDCCLRKNERIHHGKPVPGGGSSGS
jgi:hypothetical protein